MEFEDLFCKISTFGVFTFHLGKKVEGSLPYLSGPYTTAIFYNLQPESANLGMERKKKEIKRVRNSGHLPVCPLENDVLSFAQSG
jgi:hypothetical protein